MESPKYTNRNEKQNHNPSNNTQEEIKKEIHNIIDRGLWPNDKNITDQAGIEALEKLGYQLYYKGKNADLYTIPGVSNQILMYRSDRCSVFDIPLDLEIDGKGSIQNQISIRGANFAKTHGIKIANTNEKQLENIPDDIKNRIQIVKLGKILSIEINQEEVGLELIFRNYLTGSLYKAYKEGKDPYNLKLEDGMVEWDKIPKGKGFTPTTKQKMDIPLDPELVKENHSDIIKKLEELFQKFTEFAYEKGYIIIDTKFEVFIDPETQEWFLGDEILTPESSRFIKRDDFEKQNYISADKQIIRNIGKEHSWQEKWKQAKKIESSKEFLEVGDDVQEADKQAVINGYKEILSMMK